MHSEAHQLYKIILKYVCFAKELEFYLRIEYSLLEANISRCFVEKKVPETGSIVHEGVPYSWHFHGNGITWQSEALRFHYNTFPKNAFNVAFTSSDIKSFIIGKKIDFSTNPLELDALLAELAAHHLLIRLFPEYEVYTLAC